MSVQGGPVKMRPEAESRILVHLPLLVTLLLAFCLLRVVAGPCLMSQREPLRPAGPLTAYSLGLVALLGYVFYEFMATSLLANYSYFCQLVDYSQAIDTVFFILQKKPESVTFLHVYSHDTMLFNWWAAVKYVLGGQAFCIGVLNSLVHVFMYLYWGLALPVVEGQLMAIAVHSSYNLFALCPFPDGFNVTVLLYTLSLITLFLDFYHQTYLRGKRDKLA
ncbi:Elongation of very long chain fatty acids protein 4 [Camelus dromedarius]|uniref:Elongation of very long chain fatty acids protein n=1 Tax=Camelus dromedarius TaxID=9838 RepID=A0A5N4C5U8_CAMDR|nr:Elongation of very long chain fatty acids protein 4 [Camelus dromedarius]